MQYIYLCDLNIQIESLHGRTNKQQRNVKLKVRGGGILNQIIWAQPKQILSPIEIRTR